MPDKPDTWVLLLAWASQHSQTISAGLLALGMAALRIVYRGGTLKDVLIEAPMCVLIVLSLTWGLEFMSWPAYLAQPAGIWVGFIGVKKIASWADRIADARLPKSDAGQ
ncbi:phage holin, lambda family [Pseudomonas soli]|uniref:Phage holin, lambda family n=1 Tax=Pseudomonas soli TaxID=1306993 RepID=A0ABU7GWJ7_9PSED|nr:phage holin, lambda family [Pseudomonas soli]MEE1883361.1 phage holin, lambda family [Pseudomonas soli]